MYVPGHFSAPEDLISELTRTRVAILITHGEEGFQATHLPMLWRPETRMLEGHIARANPHHQSNAREALVIVPGADAYVSPSYYPSKGEHGKVVPTWNYESVHAYGALEWFHDAQSLHAIVSELSDRHEAGRAKPWGVADAPAPYIENMLRAIVGVRIAVSRIEAKQKLSQNKSGADFDGVRDGLAGEEGQGARDIASAMRKISDT